MPLQLRQLVHRPSILAALLIAAIVVYYVYPRKPFIVFELDPILWADGGPHPVQIRPTFPERPPSSKALGAEVPNIIHYVLFARADGTSIIDYRQYLAVRSALVIQRPAAIYL